MSSFFKLTRDLPLRLCRLKVIKSVGPFVNSSSSQGIYCFNNLRLFSCLKLEHAHHRSCIKNNQTSLTIPVRSLVYYSRRGGKRKTVKSVIRRFRRTGSGKWKRWQAGRTHHMTKKSAKRKTRLRRYVICNKQQTKLLNKMVNGW
ncbi:large ribosomal subunit protein bL35m-like [Dysidea avara]|uniref:large ribosomal subunit protein bL35m-like n=1 Tax=Dysidea avara TaxID=196820 RepID=UPI0033290083